MRINSIRIKKRLAVGLAFISLGLSVLLALANDGDQDATSKHQVFIAFGFHGNLYHSFRNDTNDESGFGKDIRIIRHTIRTLDRLNAMGVPVKGVWDFDNLFSLQEILPQYAPDIITNIRRRIHADGDEVILMSYNNGLVSAMTPEELDDAVRWSISNPWQSGVKDLFGTYTPIVRPQEMMTTPGNFAVYKKYGIRAVSLYYSATPFDTFRVFSRPLSRAEAHNPIRYRNPHTKEEMVVIPTYHMGDLLEHVSLRHWASELHHLQVTGKLDRDALIFINFDADSELWNGVDLPWALKWLPNTGGLDAMVREVADLPFVHFTTVGNYLTNHKPVGTFFFSQDTADGSFNGYNSWAEKAQASRYWTTIERNRDICDAARKAQAVLGRTTMDPRLETLLNFALKKRLRALSTTNFGMATPFLARQREQVMAELVQDLDGYSDQMAQIIAQALRRYVTAHPSPEMKRQDLTPLDTVMVLQPEHQSGNPTGRFLKVDPPKGYLKSMHLALLDSQGVAVPVVNLGLDGGAHAPKKLTLFIPGAAIVDDGIYRLCAVKGASAILKTNGGGLRADRHGISNGHLSLRLRHGRVEGIYLDGVRQTDTGSLMPYLRWKGTTYPALTENNVDRAGADGGSVSLRVTGPLQGPPQQTQTDGWMDYRFTVIKNLPYLLVQGKIHYPSTQSKAPFKPGKAGLMRRIDADWQEVAPAEIRFAARTTRETPVRVWKENYLGITGDYALDYYRYSDRNLNLDDVNNHITAAYVGVTVGRRGMAVAMDTSVQSNFAFTPLKMRFDPQTGAISVWANPFGTYQGRQYVPPTRGNGNGYEATLLAGEQFAGAGPTYNGVEQHFNILYAFFNSDAMPDKIREDLNAFAHPLLGISSSQSIPSPPPDQPAAPKGLVATYTADGVQFTWDTGADPHGHYRIFCGKRPGRFERVYPAVGSSVKVSRFTPSEPFKPGKRYYAAITRVTAQGKSSIRSPEIRFVIEDGEAIRPKIPLVLELKVLWANVSILLDTLWRNG